MVLSAGTTPLGISLRHPHLEDILNDHHEITHIEILIDNYLDRLDEWTPVFNRIKSKYKIFFHSVSMNLGSVDPLDLSFIKQLRKAVERFEPAGVSDHISWSAINGCQHHDLLPLPYTRESLRLMTDKVQKVQEILKQPLTLENPSSYLSYAHSEYTEFDFINRLCRHTGCGLLLDLNNVVVSAFNLSLNVSEYCEKIDLKNLSYMHLAGHEDRGTYLFDDHGSQVGAKVWGLFKEISQIRPECPGIIEWDKDLPSFSTLIAEVKKGKILVGDQCGIKKNPERVLKCSVQTISEP